jgi:predicted DCC family thiol-disulfide oxidoreductase YuxK
LGRYITINPIIFFDGICNLCNSSVQFVIERDSNKHFRFATLQSNFAHELLKNKNKESGQMDTIILLDGDNIYKKSTAALRIARSLDGGWPILYGFIIIPSFLRDFIYDKIANNRYKWFGKRNSCMVPSDDVIDLFIE